MTAKKMADIFFGKFSELISPKTFDKKEDVIKETEQNKTEGKIDYGYATAAIILGIFLIWWVFLI